MCRSSAFSSIRGNTCRTLRSSSAVPSSEGKTHSGTGSPFASHRVRCCRRRFEEDAEQLGGDVEESTLVRLRGGQDTADEVPLNHDEPAVPVDVRPLQGDLLAQPRPVLSARKIQGCHHGD
jgi:hypothetical protein